MIPWEKEAVCDLKQLKCCAPEGDEHICFVSSARFSRLAAFWRENPPMVLTAQDPPIYLRYCGMYIFPMADQGKAEVVYLGPDELELLYSLQQDRKEWS